MERRSSLRRPIHQDAMIHLAGGAVWPCVIADFCQEGMLLKYSLSASSAIQAYQSAHPNSPITIVFKEENKTSHSVEAHPVHMMKGAAGVRYTGPFNNAVYALETLAGEGNEQRKHSKEIEAIVEECIATIQNYVSPLMEECYPTLIAGIQESANKASSDQVANANMAAASRIQHESAAIHQAFLSALQDPLNQQQDGSDAISGKLSLIDKGEFEDWLTTRVVITKAETNYREHLLPLKLRMDTLGLADKKHHQSPFGPSLLVTGFQTALTRMSFDHSIEKVAFTVFETTVMAKLEELYIELNEVLTRHGVLSELDITKQIKKSPARPEKTARPTEEQTEEHHEEPRSKQGPSSNQPEAPLSNVSEKNSSNADGSNQNAPEASADDELPQFAYGGQGDRAPSDSAQDHSISLTAPPFSSSSPVQSDSKAIKGPGPAIDNASNYNNILGMVQSLNSSNAQQQGIGATDEAGNPLAPKEKFSDAEFKKGLSELQATTANEVHALEERIGLLERVLGNLSEGSEEEKVIDESQQVAIDVVDRFFSSLKGNPRLTSDAKQQLFKLEVPVLKVLLENEGFFDDHDSSVRAVMNRIAQLGATGSRLNPASKKRVESLVHQIVQEFEHDTSVFDSALEEFDKIVERQNNLYVKNVERVAAAADGAHRLEQAKIAVANALNQRIAKGPIPQAVATLIDSGWKELLNLTHIKYGENTPEWTRYLAVLDDLIDYAQDPAQPIQMSSLIPTIQEGLKQVSGHEQAPSNVRDELKRFFEDVPSGQHLSTIPEALEVPESELDITQRNLKKSSELKPWILRAKSIQIGTWIQFNREEEETQYMRLVWVAKGYSKYVFVNHQGMKVVELGLFKIASYLKDGIITPDTSYEMPIVNQGLDDMVKDVYDKLAFEASHDQASGLANKSEFCRQVRAIMKSGKRTSACTLLRLRFVSRHNVEEAQLPKDLIQSISEVLKPKQNTCNIAARISDTDFVLFVSDDPSATDEATSNLVQTTREECTSICEQTWSDSHFMSLSGESQAHLGFNNPESMLQHASEPIEKRQHELASVAASFDEQLSPEEKSQSLVESNTFIETKAFEETPILINPTEEEEELSGLEGKDFNVYCQKAMSISPDSIHEEQYELLVAERGYSVAFEPSTEAQARFLDQWWINLLMDKQKQKDPLWDRIDYMRIKLSGYAFDNDLFKEQLLLLAETGDLHPNRIWFDLYSCSVIPNMHAAADMMKQLMAKGYRFCLDQFGTSESPFPLIKVFPVDLIKVDQAYMDALNEESHEEHTANSVIEVAHYLGKEVLTSAVDSAICLQRMKQLGVDYVQGTTISEYELLEDPSL